MNTSAAPKPLLYLEDDEALAFVTSKALTKRGFELTHLASIAALEARTNLADYEYALLDLRLEDGNSIKLIQLLLEHNAQIKIVVLTGYASVATAVQAIKLGAVNYLAKPASIEQIIAAFDGDADAPAVDDAVDEVSLRRLEWERIQQVLVENDGNISATARQLKMHRRTLQRKLSKKPVSE